MPRREPDSSAPPETDSRQRALRSDAIRNRQRIIETAFDVFAAEGLSVPVHEIARRAGVGTGTVSRHFPTKESLFQAVLLSRIERLVAIGHDLAEIPDRAEAFFAFFTELLAEGVANRGIAEALAGAGCDLAAISSGDLDVMAFMGELLAASQAQGAIRADATIGDVKALLNACLQRDQPAQDRMLSIVRAGLATGPHLTL